jgi:hypothetical protein
MDEEFHEMQLDIIRDDSEERQIVVVEGQIFKIPDELVLKTTDTIFAQIQKSQKELEDAHQSNVFQLKISTDTIDNLKAKIKRYESDLSSYSSRYDYFQELKAYFFNLSEFLDDKLPLLHQIQDELLLVAQNTYLERTKIRANALNDASLKFSGQKFVWKIESHDLIKTVPEILQERDEFFDDTSRDFSTIALIGSKFQEWLSKFHVDYQKAHGAQSLATVLDLFVRYEMLEWNPFNVILL